VRDIQMPPKKGNKLAVIRKALASSDPLGNVREAIAEENKTQKVVVWAFACILETNSAGLTILFERFTLPEIARIERTLAEIGASRTLADLRALLEVFQMARDRGVPRFDASDALNESAIGRAANKRGQAQVAEMEAKLLEYCKAHEQELAAD
jgi:hypothetical protein